MSLGRNVNQLPVLSSAPADSTLFYTGIPPFDTASDYAISYGVLKASLSGNGAWTTITTNTTLAPNTNYFVNSATAITLTLPSSFNRTDIIRIIGINAGLWTINQNSSQGIIIGSRGTTTGVTGHVAATNGFDQLSLIGVVSNSIFVSFGAPLGSLTVT